MARKARLGLYLKDDNIKKQIKIAAAKRGISTTIYCAQAIEERLKREGELAGDESERKAAFLAQVDKLRKDIGTVNVTAAELIAFCRERLAHFKCPGHVEFGPLPRTATGKVRKNELRAKARE